MIGQYFKFRFSPLIVEAVTECTENVFKGKVVVSDGCHEIGIVSNWSMESFEPYSGTETTQDNPTPAKDTELRLECLKLAVQLNGEGSYAAAAIEEAKEFYEWVTKTH